MSPGVPNLVRMELPGPCHLCGGHEGTRANADWRCSSCGWRYGDAPDYDVPRPRVDVVYYVRFADRVKIGTSSQPRTRLSALRFEELLAFERGGRTLEQRRHREYASLRGTGEWFRLQEPLVEHVARLSAAGDPWTLYGRWVADALAGARTQD